MEEPVTKTILLAACLPIALATGAQAKTSNQNAEFRCADYQRNSDGSWTTKRDVLMRLPGGNATINSNVTFPANGTYMGVQFGFLLDKDCRRSAR
jgi:hypothetical protein